MTLPYRHWFVKRRLRMRLGSLSWRLVQKMLLMWSKLSWQWLLKSRIGTFVYVVCFLYPSNVIREKVEWGTGFFWKIVMLRFAASLTWSKFWYYSSKKERVHFCSKALQLCKFIIWPLQQFTHFFHDPMQDGKSTNEQCKATDSADPRTTCQPEIWLLLLLVDSIARLLWHECMHVGEGFTSFLSKL